MATLDGFNLTQYVDFSTLRQYVLFNPLMCYTGITPRNLDAAKVPILDHQVVLLDTFTFSHLADAFIQSDLHMCDLQCIHILHFFYIYTDGTLHIRSN